MSSADLRHVTTELENVVNKYEHKDMMARLLGNLGVVLESLGEYDKGINLLLKSVNICKSHDLYEQLQRSYTCLASLYCSKGEFDNAIQQYNSAMEVAKRLKNRVALKEECLKNKAEILIKLADFHAAKIVLLKAYKLKLDSADNEDIEQKLKVVAAICYAEDSLLTTSDSDYYTKKHLYEKLGDGACFLNNYPIAIKHYQKMLDAAINNGESGLDLGPCYISLAATYRDNKQFELALKYYQKDYELTNTISSESINNLLTIADVMEAGNKDILDIEKVYDQAINQSSRLGDKNIQHRILKRQIIMLQKKGRSKEATQLENRLKDMGIETLLDSESLDEELTTNIGDDISIKDITDISSDSDADNVDVSKPRTSRRRSKAFAIKKNPKGETQLHTACIAGNVELVRRLLDQGHVVNIRDNCGWLPLHEACICGHFKIVEMLIEKGAWINDRGGRLCDGITPLHDAASNGHLEIIQFLLDKGASATAKTNSALMPLHMLEQWHKTNHLDSERLNLYTIVKLRLMQDMEKLGQSRDTILEVKECKAFVTEDTLERAIQPPKKNKLTIEKRKGIVGKLRRNISRDIDLDQHTSFSDDSESSNEALNISELLISSNSKEQEIHAKEEYKKVIENLRHPFREGNVEKKRKSTESSHPALLEPGEVGDDWLEDDMPVKAKSRKHKPNTILTKRRSTGSLRRNSSTSSKSSKTEFENLEEFFASDFAVDEVPNFQGDYNSLLNTENTTAKKRKTQTTLIEQGFSRQRSFSPNNCSSNTNKNMYKQKHQSKITSFCESSVTCDFISLMEPNSVFNTHSVTNIFNPEPTLSIDVRIDGKLYRVPVLASELQFKTVGWLANEAADRYSRKESIKPTLELETKNGALLAEDDFLNILFTVRNMQAEEVHARVVKWNLPSLGDRYIEACEGFGIGTNSTILKILLDTSTSLNLAGMGIGHINFRPLCKAINRQINLHYLNLSDNFMRDSSLQLLSLSLSSLDNLAALDLSNNELTSEGLKCLVDIFVQSQKSLLTNLISLNLSHNSLGDESLKSLAILTRHLKLQILDLVDVGFSNQIFDSIPNRNLNLCLEYITNINLSYNKLNRQQIVTILTWINPQQCEELNISSNNVTEHGLLKEIIYWIKSRGTETLKLKSLNLTRCKATDSEVEELLRLMPCLHDFKSLDLSYNENLTINTLVAVLKYPLTVYLIGCESILSFEDLDLQLCIINIRELVLSPNCKQYVQKNNLIDALRNAYQERVKFHELKDYLKVTLLV